MAHNIFLEHEYRDALQRHYGRLLQLSSQAMGKPNDKELAMLDKITELEEAVAAREGLQASEWDPIRDSVRAYPGDVDDRNAKQRDKDVQVSIYGLETSLQSIQTMDACFGQIIDGAARELGNTEMHFLKQKSKGYMRPKSGVGSMSHANANSRGGNLGSSLASASGSSSFLTTELPASSRFPPIAAQAHEDLQRRRERGEELPGHPGRGAATEFWGTPIHFSPAAAGAVGAGRSPSNHNHNHNRSIGSSSRVLTMELSSEQSRLQAEASTHEASRQKDAIVKHQVRSERAMQRDAMYQAEAEEMVSRMAAVEDREHDYEMFVILADRFGPMPPLTFCASNRPGRTYERLLYKLACRIELWAKIWVPRRGAMKGAAIGDMQRIVRGHLGRVEFRFQKMQNGKLKIFITMMTMRCVAQTFSAWDDLVVQQKKARDLFKRMMGQLEQRVFSMWRAGVQEIVDAREEKVRISCARLLNRKLHGRFELWVETINQIKCVRRIAKSIAERGQNEALRNWRDYCRFLRRDRDQQWATCLLQRVARGMFGRWVAREKREEAEWAARLLQRIARGLIGRSRVRALRQRARLLGRRERRQQRQVRMRRELEAGEAAEIQRAQDEMQATDDGEAGALERLETTLRTKEGKKLLARAVKDLTAALAAERKAAAEDAKNDTTLLPKDAQGSVEKPPAPRQSLKERALADLRHVAAQSGGQKALVVFRQTRPPPHLCPEASCAKAFPTDRALKDHYCEPVLRLEALLAVRRTRLRAELEAIDSVLFASQRPTSPAATNNFKTLSAVR